MMVGEVLKYKTLQCSSYQLLVFTVEDFSLEEHKG